MLTLNRPLLKQEAVNFSCTMTVANQPVPLNAQMGLTSMVDSFLVCVPSTAGTSVFIGFDPNVTPANGVELIAGITVQFIIDNQGRQLYEIQGLLSDLTVSQTCRQQQLEAIPYTVWDLSSIYLVVPVVVPTVVGVIAFKAVYI